jgi:hypothetical protein
VAFALGEGATLSTGKAAEASNMKDGEARFLAIGSMPRLMNSGSSTVPVLVVELKQHWEAEVRACSEPAKCTRPIRMGEFSIGETTFAFHKRLRHCLSAPA